MRKNVSEKKMQGKVAFQLRKSSNKNVHVLGHCGHTFPDEAPYETCGHKTLLGRAEQNGIEWPLLLQRKHRMQHVKSYCAQQFACSDWRSREHFSLERKWVVLRAINYCPFQQKHVRTYQSWITLSEKTNIERLQDIGMELLLIRLGLSILSGNSPWDRIGG